MEKKVEKLTELKVGDIVLIDTPLQKDSPMVLSTIFKVFKYPIENKDDGKGKYRNTHINGVLTSVYAKDEGNNGDEMIDQYGFIGLGSMDLTEDDYPLPFNMRLIDDKHPKYDKTLVDEGNMFNNMMGMFEKMFND